MAATFNESQKIDYLWKKVGYGVTKTAEVTSKEAYNESIASPLLYRGDLVWMQSDQITGTPPASTSSIIQVYKDGVGSYSPSVECTEDLTSPDNQTWKTNLTNWVPTQFGDNYLIQVYVANTGVTNPQTSGIKLFQAGSGSDDTWFFDYQSGVLNFNGATIPTQISGGITGKSIYIVGFRYVGLLGTTNLPSNTYIGNLNFTGTTISSTNLNGNITITPNGTGSLNVTSVTNLGAVGNVKITGGTNGYVLQTDGVGNLSWTAQSGGAGPGGSNTQVQFNNAGNFAGTAGFTFDSTSNTLTATNISGNGSGISSITGANVTGIVANATYATSAGTADSANSVAGANVTGTVANATYALTSNSSTYADQATYADTANSVAGANVSGTVANATYATSAGTADSANSVAGANVSGIVANATYATSAGSADSATTASTVTTNAQPNITSVGSLANLTVTGNAIINADLTANSLTIGSGIYQFSRTSMFFATTISSATQQILALDAEGLAGLDLVIISTDATDNSRQITKLSMVIYDGVVSYNDTSTLAVNNYLCEFSVNYVSISNEIQINSTPAFANFMDHKMQIISYNE